jgi:hypothetical protein
MSIKYFTGNNVAGNSCSGKIGTLTAPTAFWYPETAPVNNVDGIDAKGQGVGSKFDRIKAKVHSTSALAIKGGKGRGTFCVAKYDLGKMWKYRKTLKKLLTAAGASASTGTPKGERNMYSLKGNGNTGDTAAPKNVQQTPLADSYELWPIDAGK